MKRNKSRLMAADLRKVNKNLRRIQKSPHFDEPETQFLIEKYQVRREELLKSLSKNPFKFGNLQTQTTQSRRIQNGQ